MAEETTESPIAAAEPPKVDPLAKPATLKLEPIARKPVTGLTQTGLKPGLKLPPKPGATVALKPGLKLPPKPGATVALKPGLKLPPKPGATVAAKPVAAAPGATVTATLKPGLKLPPKPVIRKPGATVAAKPLPKPVVPGAAPVAATPAPAAPAAPAAAAPAPAPVAPAPVEAAKPVEPAKPTVVPVDAQGVGKLPTVEAKAISRDSVNPVVPASPMEALKTVTQKLKGITQSIPQQAILRKTGIIAEEVMTDAQRQAAKSKTARISLSDAMGVAPVKNEAAPMKTIRIKRPIDIPGAVPPKAEAAPAAPAAAAAEEAKPEEAAASTATITQRKTLKIARPGGAVRPTGKFGIKRSPSQAATVVKPAGAAAESAEGETPVADTVADIPDIPNIPDLPPVAAAPAVSDGPAWLWTLSALIQVAACVAMGALAWFLYQNSQTQYF